MVLLDGFNIMVIIFLIKYKHGFEEELSAKQPLVYASDDIDPYLMKSLL